ncbi:hypothetical protein HBB16_01870 [Pseudonocardia sp. MCCB 268]|nr:hypothetical protein [Pseudonocardia cytotoxica]
MMWIKISDMTPHTGTVFARAVASRMDADEVAVVNGGLATAEAFSEPVRPSSSPDRLRLGRASSTPLRPGTRCR